MTKAADDQKLASTASEEVDDFLAELNAEFGKKPRLRTSRDTAAARNKAFQTANPTLERIAGGQLPANDAGEYNWGNHLAWLRQGQASGLPPPKWLPEARVTWIVHQQCAVCSETAWYTGNEYVRFRRNSRHGYRTLKTEEVVVREGVTYQVVRGDEVRIAASVLRRIGECDPHLVAYGLPDGTALPEELHEAYETVLRCPACYHLERACHDLWNAATAPADQQELPGLDDLLKEATP